MRGRASSSDDSSGQRTDWGWLVAIAVLAGVLYPASRYMAGLQDADGILTSLISTQKLTWYFWGQDRLLNLLPALAYPIRDPEANLHFQVFLRALMAFLAPMGVLAFFERGRRHLLVLTAVSGLVLAGCSRGYSLFNLYVQHNPFSTSLVLFGGSALAARRWRGGWAVLIPLSFGFLAYSVNFALVLFSIPFLMLCLVIKADERKYLGRLLAVQVVAIILAFLHAKLFGESSTSFGINPSIDAVRSGWLALAEYLRLPWLGALFLPAAAAALLTRDRNAWLALLVAAGMPLAVSAMSCLTWLQANQFNVRYFLPFVLVFCTCCTYLIVSPFAHRSSLGAQRSAAIGCVLAIFCFCLGGLAERPGELIAPTWRESSRTVADAAAREHVQLIAGDFWEVWPSVFRAREQLRERAAGDAPLFGASLRGHVLSDQIVQALRARGRLRSLCLLESLHECIETTTRFATNGMPVHYLDGSFRRVELNGRTGLVYDVALGDVHATDANFCLMKSPLDRDAPHLVGEWRQGALVNAGQEGVLLYGPYRFVPAGRYRLRLAGDAGDTEGAWVDVVSDAGRQAYGRVGLSAERSGLIAEMIVELPQAVPDLEIRVWAGARNQVAIRGYSLSPSDREPAGCTLSAFRDATPASQRSQ